MVDSTMNELDRARGAFVGLAVGDALGTAVEFKYRGEFEPLTDMIGGGAFRLQPGEWTDDTSMALCLAETILETGDVDRVDLLTRFTKWWREGYNSVNGRCFDIGTTTKNSLWDWERNGATRAEDAPHLAGNGSIMRLAPVAIRWANDPLEVLEKARVSSEVTHGAFEACNACETLAIWLIQGIKGEPQQLNNRLMGMNSSLIQSTGYVAHTMIAAQWAVLNTDNFNDAVLMAANLGDDADTTAAVAGQIAGAKYGMSGIREDWLEKLAWREQIVDLADRLYQAGQ